MENCPQVLAELHICCGSMVFKEPTRTLKNLLSLSYCSRLSCVKPKLSVTASPHFIAGDFNVLYLKIPSLAMCMEQGGWVDLESAFASGHGRQPTGTCKVGWTSDGICRDFLVARPLPLTSALNCSVDQERWLKPHFPIKATLDVDRCVIWLHRQLLAHTSWLVRWVQTGDKFRHSTSQDVINIWEVYDSGLQYLSMEISRSLQISLKTGNVSTPLVKVGLQLREMHFAMRIVWQVVLCLPRNRKGWRCLKLGQCALEALKYVTT